MDLPIRSPRFPKALPFLCLCLALAGLAGCARPAAEKDGAPAPAGLEILEARATFTPDAGAVYLTVVNHGRKSDRLLRVETAAAGRAETHESLEENGVVRMVARPQGFEVPAGGKLELAPGGKHVMLLETRAPEPTAADLPLTLHFERAGTLAVRAALSPMGKMDHAHMDHGAHADPGAPTPDPPRDAAKEGGKEAAR